MPPTGGRVSSFGAQVSGSGSPAARARALAEAVGQLDDLHGALTTIEASRPRSVHDWIVGSLPLQMRLPEVERGLAILRALDPTTWPDTHWALDLDEARAQIEEALEQLLVILVTLLEAEPSPEERVRLSRRFKRHADAALEGVERLRGLTASWRPSRDGYLAPDEER
jgi:hypothetical protein